jgi:hypothetical protein
VNEGRLVVLYYVELSSCWRRGLRNGNWQRLGLMDKIFYRAAVWYVRIKNKITNNKMVAQLRCIAQKLKTTISNKILQAGLERVREISAKFEQNGVFIWAPKLKTWLKDSKYIFWLGLSSQSPHGNWVMRNRQLP